MIRQLLLLLLGLLTAMWWSRRLLAASRRQRPVSGAQAGPRQVKDLGPMVRDRVCNTYLPKSRALAANVDSQEHFFCSEKCRREFLSHRTLHTA